MTGQFSRYVDTKAVYRLVEQPFGVGSGVLNFMKPPFNALTHPGDEAIEEVGMLLFLI
jgi:hypothetical protein